MATQVTRLNTNLGVVASAEQKLPVESPGHASIYGTHWDPSLIIPPASRLREHEARELASSQRLCWTQPTRLPFRHRTAGIVVDIQPLSIRLMGSFSPPYGGCGDA